MYEKIIKIIYLENTNWDESNKIQHDYVFSYVYGVKDSQSYDVDSAYGQNVATKLRRREYKLGKTAENIPKNLSTLQKKLSTQYSVGRTCLTRTINLTT